MRAPSLFLIPAAVALFTAPARADLSFDSGFPTVDGQVYAMVENRTTLYIGGNFSTVGGLTRHNLAAIDLASGIPTDWDPNADARVTSLLFDGATVYAGGDFLHVGGAARSSIAALDAFTGAATAWNPGSSGRVSALAVSGSVVYAGGDFTAIGGQSRKYLAAIDAATGVATAWNPGCDGHVGVLTVNGSTLYVGGSFTRILQDSRRALAAVDLPGGTLNSWNAHLTPLGASVQSLAADGSKLYVGGQFSAVGIDTRTNLAAVDMATASPTAWSPNPNGAITAIAVRGPTVYVGGGSTFQWFGISDGSSGSVVFCYDRLGQVDGATGIGAELFLPYTIIANVSAMVADASGLRFGGFNQHASDGTSVSSVLSFVDPAANVGVDPLPAREPSLALRARGFRGDLIVTFSLPAARPARIEVFDVSGRRVLDRDVAATGTGERVQALDANELRPGLYLLRLSQGSRSVGARAILLR